MKSVISAAIFGPTDELIILIEPYRLYTAPRIKARPTRISTLFPRLVAGPSPDATGKGRENGELNAHENGSSQAHSVQNVLSDKEIDAAHIIWQAYKAYCARRKSLTSYRSQIFVACLRVSSGMAWRRRRYALLYLGALPHLYTSLQAMDSHVQTQKTALKKELQRVSHLKLEEVQNKITQIK